MSIVENGYHTPVFDHALTTVCLLTTWPRKGQSRQEPQSLPGMNRLAEVSTLEGPNGRAVRTNEHLTAELIPKLAALSGDGRENKHTLGGIFKIRRGAATGSNDYFLLSRSQARKLGIKRSELAEIIRKLRPNSGPTNELFLWLPQEIPSEASLQRIREGEALGINKRYLCSQRRYWWRVEHHGPPAYFLSYMGRRKPLVVENGGQLLHLNNIHGLYIKDGVSRETAKRVVKWLNSEEGIAALIAEARHYYGGMWKLEPGDAERVCIPARYWRV